MVIKKVEVVVMRNPRLDALDEAAVIGTGKDLRPGMIQKWSVIVEGKEFPCKQIVQSCGKFCWFEKKLIISLTNKRKSLTMCFMHQNHMT